FDIESTAALLDWPGREPSASDFALARRVAPVIDAAYEQLMLFGEHTWGLDVKSTIRRAFGPHFESARQTDAYKRLEASWAAKAGYVDRAEEALAPAAQMVEEALQASGMADSLAEQENAIVAGPPNRPNVVENQ